MNFENVVFDLDGTLVDSLPGIEYSVDQALDKAGYPPRVSSLRPLIGPPIRQILGHAARETDPRNLDRLEHAFRLSYDFEGWTKTVLNCGAKETLDWLVRSKCRVFMVTNKPVQATSRILEHFELADAFSRVVCRDSAEPPYESKSEMLKTLMRADGIGTQNTIVIGDTMEDLKAAEEASMEAAILTSGYGGFIDSPAHASCRFLKELSELRSMMVEPEESND